MSRKIDDERKKPMLVPLQSEKRPKGVPVYRDPENPFNTWAGYGKRPAWLQERIEEGVSLADMKVPGAMKVRDNQTPRYRNPGNPEQQWSGFGRRPKWLIDLLKQGITLDDLKI